MFGNSHTTYCSRPGISVLDHAQLCVDAQCHLVEEVQLLQLRGVLRCRDAPACLEIGITTVLGPTTTSRKRRRRTSRIS